MRWELQSFPRGTLLFACRNSLAPPWKGLAAGLFSLQPKVFWRKSSSLPFGFESGYLPAFFLPDWLSVPLAWPHTCDMRKLVMLMAWRGSSRALTHSQGHRGNLWESGDLKHESVLGLLTKSAATKHIWKKRPFFLPYKMWVEFFLDQLCFSWSHSEGLWITQHQWFFASGLGLSCWAIPLMPALGPTLSSSQRGAGGASTFPHAHTHRALELFSAPTAQAFGSAPLSQAGEEAGDSSCSCWLCKPTEMHFLDTRRRHEMQSLIPRALCAIYKQHGY